MSINTKNEITTKTSFIRLQSLKKRFLNNYKYAARENFMKLDRKTQLKILSNEFIHDKEMLITLDHLSPRLISRIIKQRGLEYLYATSYDGLKYDLSSQTHIRHNAYRTIAALLLQDCSMEEKALALSISMNRSHFKDKELLEIATARINNMINCINEANFDITL